jgi:cytochrome c-type biogenesis protein CcmH
MKLRYAALMVAVSLFAAVPLRAQTVNPADAALNAHVNAIAKQLRCPVCQGLSLADSQSELSSQMRSVIKDQINAGQSDAQIIDYFVAKYGEWILLEPKPSGFNLIAYFLPLIMLAAGIGVIYVSVKKWTRAEPQVRPT